MLSLKSITNLAELLWSEFDARVDWAEILGYRGIGDNALSHFEEVAIEVIEDKIGIAGVDLSSDLQNDIVNQLTVMGVKDANRLYCQGTRGH